MYFAKYFGSNPAFYAEQELFYQTDLPKSNPFEQSYINLRDREDRVYSDDVVRRLPSIDSSHPTAKEWKMRKHSADKLIQYLSRKNHFNTIVEVGCGNGWLTHHLSKSLEKEFLGVDINLTELQQATRLFKSDRVHFAYADIQSHALNSLKADVILLPSCLQYFKDASWLLYHLRGMLHKGGELHIVDTPIYRTEDLQAARERSSGYFENRGNADMKSFYYHHDWQVFDGLPYHIQYDPSSLINKLKSIARSASPFPWVKIGTK
jgi:ubiquinone/menaquinone biosynthesis C-methylase UbiE